jgi:hypothetical protein
MKQDIRLSVSFFNHPKTILLMRRSGPVGVLALLRLWCFCGVYKQDGNLSNMNELEIEIAAGWTGEDGKFVESLLETKFLEKQGECYKIHDWDIHNKWAFYAPERTKTSRMAALYKYGKTKEANKLRKELGLHAKRIRNASESDASATAQRYAPSPSPLPLPSPSPSPLPSPFQSVVDYFYTRCKEVRGFKPSIDGKDGKRVKEALKVMSLEDIKSCIDFFLPSQKADACGITLSIALSNHTLNKFKQGEGENVKTRFERIFGIHNGHSGLS